MLFLKRTRVFVFLALFISLEIVLTRFFSIQTPIIRIGFGFLPLVLSAVMFGPIYSGVAAMLADILGMLLFPQGTYFPGFTFSALLSGIIYGVILYNKPVSIIRTAFAVILVALFIDLGLNTLWLYIITGKAGLALLFPRAIKSMIMFPIQVASINVVLKYTRSVINFPLLTERN